MNNMIDISRKYSLNDFNNIIFNGFDFNVNEQVLKIISELAGEVGAPTYIKTPDFKKKEINSIKSEKSLLKMNDVNFKKRRNNKDFLNSEELEQIKNFQTTKIEKKCGLDADIEIIRNYLNKITDNNFSDIKTKIIEIIDKLIENNILIDDMKRVSSIIFDIASNNRYYSKLYSNLYSELIKKYEMMKNVFEVSFDSYISLFDDIQYIEPSIDYDKYCNINKENEKRKSLSAFFINLMENEIISKVKIVTIIRNLLFQVYTFVSEENKKNEVDEIIENIFILYNKNLFEKTVSYDLIDNMNMHEVIKKLSSSKVKDYKSLTNKSIFKLMDIIEL